MNASKRAGEASGRRPGRYAWVALSALLATAACENHGKPFVPVGPHGPDSTLVSGPEEGRWVARKSPYYVVASVHVLRDRLLVIDPGVTVVFTRKDFGMLVEGRLVAVGTRDSTIIFRPTYRSDTSPHPGLWTELTFQGSRQDNRVEFADFRYARRAIRAIDSNLTLRNVQMRNNELDCVNATRCNLDLERCTLSTSGRYGLFLDGCESPPYTVRLDHLNLGFNQNAGLWSMNSSFRLTNCDIKNNGFDGTPALNAASSGVHCQGVPGLLAPVIHACNIDLNRPCDVRNLMSDQSVLRADSNYWGPNTTRELVINSGGRKDRCNYNLRAICDGLDSLTADFATVNVCQWSDTFFPNFPGSGQAATWDRLAPRAR